jgi:hypothetical protein
MINRVLRTLNLLNPPVNKTVDVIFEEVFETKAINSNIRDFFSMLNTDFDFIYGLDYYSPRPGYMGTGYEEEKQRNFPYVYIKRFGLWKLILLRPRIRRAWNKKQALWSKEENPCCSECKKPNLI